LLADLLQAAVQVRHGFHVYGQAVGSRPAEIGHEGLRAGGHQVHVLELGRCSGHRFHDGQAEADVGHEHAVHHVDVEAVGRAAVDHAGGAVQMAEVGRQDAGENQVLGAHGGQR
jgi:hypothetical protein